MTVDGLQVACCIGGRGPSFLDEVNLVNNESDAVESPIFELAEADGVSKKDIHRLEFKPDSCSLGHPPDTGARSSPDSFIVRSNEDRPAFFKEASQGFWAIVFLVKILDRPVIFSNLGSQRPQGVYPDGSCFFLAHFSLLSLI